MNSRQRLSNKSFSLIEQTRDELDLHLVIRQQPKHCRVLVKGEKVGRRPLEPAPVVQLVGKNKKLGDHNKDYLYSPNLFMKAILEPVEIDDGSTPDSNKNSMYSSSAGFGCTVSSVQTVKDLDKSDVSFFVFPNISVKYEGKFRLRFELYDLVGDVITKISSISGDTFVVSSAEKFPGWDKTTPLTHLLSSQGVKVNLRKRNHVTIHNSSKSLPANKEHTESQNMLMKSAPKVKKEPKVKKNTDKKPELPGSIHKKEMERLLHPSKKVKIAPQHPHSLSGFPILYQTKELHFFPFVTPFFSPLQSTPVMMTSSSSSSSSSSPFPSSPSSPSITQQKDQMTEAKLLLSLCQSLPKPKTVPVKLENQSSQLPSFFDLLNSLPPS